VHAIIARASLVVFLGHYQMNVVDEVSLNSSIQWGLRTERLLFSETYDHGTFHKTEI
jgi:hypothetical protein